MHLGLIAYGGQFDDSLAVLVSLNERLIRRIEQLCQKVSELEVLRIEEFCYHFGVVEKETCENIEGFYEDPPGWFLNWESVSIDVPTVVIHKDGFHLSFALKYGPADCWETDFVPLSDILE